MENPHKLFSKFVVHLVHIPVCPGAAVHADPRFVYALHGKHGLNVIPFQHSHRLSRLFHSRFYAVLPENLCKRSHRGKAAVVYRSSRPVENYAFYLHHPFLPFKPEPYIPA